MIVQHDLNIALMNEFSMIFARLGISTDEVLKAAGTKWNFHPYRPGMIGGHCIPVDPYYLVKRTKEVGTQELSLSRYKNNTYTIFDSIIENTA